MFNSSWISGVHMQNIPGDGTKVAKTTEDFDSDDENVNENDMYEINKVSIDKNKIIIDVDEDINVSVDINDDYDYAIQEVVEEPEENINQNVERF
jgi:hypothetical protein